MAELVYAHDLKSCLARDVGSTPTSGTSDLNKINFAPLAQLVEQIPLKDKVEGSIPSGRTKVLTYFLRGAGTTVPSRGREIFQQKNIRDHKWASGGIGIRASLRN